MGELIQMRIIISPAKKMNIDTDTLPYHTLPRFLPQTRELMDYIKTLTYGQCKAIWKCNDKIADLNFGRFADMDLERTLTPAILSYEGIQYQYMAPLVLESSALDYLQDHLRILSGFYGILKPFDGIVPYRLEMQARLGDEKLDSLYGFWGSQLADALLEEDSFILNLASKEYSQCIAAHLQPETTFVTCVFGELIDGKVVEKGTFAKMARGEMVRFLAEHLTDNIDGICRFDRMGYRFCEQRSDEKTLVFIKSDTFIQETTPQAAPARHVHLRGHINRSRGSGQRTS